MPEHKSWFWSDESTDWGVRLNPERRQLDWWGSSKSYFGPEYAHSEGGHSQSFADFLARGAWYDVPPHILKEIQESVVALSDQKNETGEGF